MNVFFYKRMIDPMKGVSRQSNLSLILIMDVNDAGDKRLVMTQYSRQFDIFWKHLAVYD